MLTTGRLSGKERAAALWQSVSTHPHRQKITASIIGLWYSVIDNQWEVSTDAHVIPGTNNGVDWGMYLGQIAIFTTICGLVGAALDRSRELKQNAGQPEDTRNWRERYASAQTCQAKAKVLIFDVSPKHLLGLLTAAAQFFNPLMLHTLFSSDKELGISGGQVEYKGFKAFYFLSAAYYAGYVLASITLNMKFAKAQVDAKFDKDNLLQPNVDTNGEANILNDLLISQAEEKTQTVRERCAENRYTVLLPLTYVTMSLMVNLWMITTDRPAIGKSNAGNELAYLVYAGLLMFPTAVAGIAADITQKTMILSNTDYDNPPPLTKKGGFTKAIAPFLPFLLLWLLEVGCAATTIGLFTPGVKVPDINDDSDAAQWCWKIFLCCTLVAAATVSAVAQRKVFSGAEALSKGVVGKLGRVNYSFEEADFNDYRIVDEAYESNAPDPL